MPDMLLNHTAFFFSFKDGSLCSLSPNTYTLSSHIYQSLRPHVVRALPFQRSELVSPVTTVMDTGLNLIPESVFSAPSRPSVVVKRHSVEECGISVLFCYCCLFDSTHLKVIGKYKMASKKKIPL